MNKEDLKKLGLEDEDVIQKIIVLHGKDIETHKTNLTAAQTELSNLQGQLKEASTTIEGFKKLDVESIKKAADDWKAKAEQAAKDAQDQVSKIKFDYALDGALSEAKAKNVKAVKALLDTQNLKLGDDGKLVGLNDQLVKVKEANDFLFESDKPQPKVVTGASGGGGIEDSVTAAARKAAGLTTEQPK